MKKIILSLTLLASVSSFAAFLNVPTYIYGQSFKNYDGSLDKASEVQKCTKALNDKRKELEMNKMTILEVKNCSVSTYTTMTTIDITGSISFIK